MYFNIYDLLFFENNSKIKEDVDYDEIKDSDDVDLNYNPEKIIIKIINLSIIFLLFVIIIISFYILFISIKEKNNKIAIAKFS